MNIYIDHTQQERNMFISECTGDIYHDNNDNGDDQALKSKQMTQCGDTNRKKV